MITKYFETFFDVVPIVIDNVFNRSLAFSQTSFKFSLLILFF